MSKDLTQGNITKNVLYMAIPTMFGYMAQMAYDIVDMMWIGRISKEAIAGVTIFTATFWLFQVLNEIIGGGSVSLISQSYGEKNIEKTKKAIEQTIVFKAFVALIAGILLFLILSPLTNFFTDDPLVKQSVLDYGYIRALFIPFLFASFSVNTAFRCVGDSRTPFYLMLLSSFLNIVLDPIFMFETVPFVGLPGLGMGVRGAAIATVVSSVVAFSIGLSILLSKRSPVRITLKGLITLDREIDEQLVRIGLPMGGETFFRNIASFILLKFIAIYGTNAVATYGIGNRLIFFFIMPLIGLEVAGSSIVGQNLGVNNIKRAVESVNSAARIGLTMMVVANVLIYTFPAQLMNLFTDSPAIIQMGVTMLKMVMPGMMFLGIMYGYMGIFAGSGYNKPIFIASMVSRWGVQLPLMVLMIFVFKMDVAALWIGLLVAELAEMLIILYYYREGKWKEVRV